MVSEQFFECVRINVLNTDAGQAEGLHEISRAFDEYFGSGDWIFRGQQDSSWHLQSSIERRTRLVGQIWSDFWEKSLMDHFKSKAHHFISFDTIPDKEERLAWLSLMQHHGAPTRLLDFTTSPYYGLFFAFAQLNQDNSIPYSSLWAINQSALREYALEKLKNDSMITAKEVKTLLLEPDSTDLIFKILTKQRMKKDKTTKKMKPYLPNVLWVGAPTKSNLRLVRQKGTFLFTSNMKSSIEELLLELYMANKGKRKVIYRIDIPSFMRKPMYGLLFEKMGIDNATLFNDLDGFARDHLMKLAIDAETTHQMWTPIFNTTRVNHTLILSNSTWSFMDQHGTRSNIHIAIEDDGIRIESDIRSELKALPVIFNLKKTSDTQYSAVIEMENGTQVEGTLFILDDNMILHFFVDQELFAIYARYYNDYLYNLSFVHKVSCSATLSLTR